MSNLNLDDLNRIHDALATTVKRHTYPEFALPYEQTLEKVDALRSSHIREIAALAAVGPVVKSSDPEQGPWYPACGGKETPFLSRSGKRLLYCWRPATGNHAYIDLDTDIVLTQEEADAALRLY